MSSSSSLGLSGLRLGQGGVSAPECDFLARESLVEISPKFSHPKLKFISGEYGPFDPMLTLFVPLWLAVTLRKKEKCRIVIPDWLLIENLQENVENERSQAEFVAMPPHYLEVAAILFECCKEDIENADRVLGLLQDLESIRADRLRLGMLSVADATLNGQRVHCVRLINVSSMEILSIKKFFLKSFQTFDKLVTDNHVSSAADEDSGANIESTAGGGGRKLRKHRK